MSNRLAIRSCAGWLLAPALFSMILTGCGGSPKPICAMTAFNVSPNTATISHAAVPPGNTQHFAAFETAATTGCAFPLSNLTTVTWTVSDPVNVSISNATADNGAATCHAATAGAVTVTGTAPAGNGANITNTASLTCN